MLNVCHCFEGQFLINNYRQATKNVLELKPKLDVMKTKLNIKSDDIFEQWRKEEHEYLKSTQSARADEDIMARAYVATLKQLKDAELVMWPP